MSRFARARVAVAIAVVLLLAASCASHTDNVCEDIADCAHGGDSTFVANCKAEAKALRAELVTYGCDSEFDEYYACQDATFQCQGATPTFACAAGLNALDTCIQMNQTSTTCAALAAKQASCTTAPPSSGPPIACTLARDCEAQCVLGGAADVCAPGADALDTIRACMNACPPPG